MSSILLYVAPQRQLKTMYRFRVFFRINFVIGISCVNTVVRNLFWNIPSSQSIYSIYLVVRRYVNEIIFYRFVLLPYQICFSISLLKIPVFFKVSLFKKCCNPCLFSVNKCLINMQAMIFRFYNHHIQKELRWILKNLPH